MLRGFMPALTLLVFGVGAGIGYAWTQGLIPLTLVPVNSGSLSVEVTQREDLPPPNYDPLFGPPRSHSPKATEGPAEDPEIFHQQSEPEPARRAAVVREASAEPNQAWSASTLSPPELPKSSNFLESASTSDDRSNPAARFRTRERSAVQLDPDAGIEEAVAPPRKRQVNVVAHQDPSESNTETRVAVRETKTSAGSPREQLASAEEKLASGETLAAHRELSRLYWNHKEFRPQVQELIDSTAKAIFFQPKPHYVEPYVIQEGDRLEVIAKKYQLSWEYLAHLNRTEPRRIQIGQKLKVMKGPFGAIVDLPEYALTIHLQGYYVKRYQVGIGKDGSSPLGKFPVLNKVENPPYTAPNGKVVAADDPMNPLGERWIDLGDSYGIHGTIDPNSIGKAESRGCIRLRDQEIIEVYDFLVKGSEVVLRK